MRSSTFSATRRSTSSRIFAAFGGAQSYPSRTKDIDDVDFSTGSVGLGVAATAFASLVQDYLHAKDWASPPAEGRMIALVGDAELDEGNIYEALLEGAKHGLRNTWWIIDYNRQSLDGVAREGLGERFAAIFRSAGWDVVILKYGSLLEAAFTEPGGAKLRRWIDACPNAALLGARLPGRRRPGGRAFSPTLSGDNEIADARSAGATTRPSGG